MSALPVPENHKRNNIHLSDGFASFVEAFAAEIARLEGLTGLVEGRSRLNDFAVEAFRQFHSENGSISEDFASICAQIRSGYPLLHNGNKETSRAFIYTEDHSQVIDMIFQKYHATKPKIYTKRVALCIGACHQNILKINDVDLPTEVSFLLRTVREMLVP